MSSTCPGALVYHTENQGTAEWGIPLEGIAAQDPPTAIRPSLAGSSAARWEPWTARLSVALVELVMSETALYEDDGLSDGTDLIDEQALAMFEPLPALLAERHESAWFFWKDALVHVLGGGWLTVRGRTPEALEAVYEVMAGDWVSG